MEMREYLEILSSQLRCKAARPAVCEELQQHIEDQAAAYEEMGLSHEEAMKKSVEQMGDPVETGVALDGIHRPKTDWKAVALILVLSAAGLLLQAQIAASAGEMEPFFRRLMFTGIGLLLMGLVYRLDYSVIGRIPVRLWFGWIFLTMFFILTAKAGRYGNVFLYRQMIGGQMQVYNLLLLFVPLYAGVLYWFRGGGYLALLAALAVALMPVFVSFQAIQTSAAVEITVCLGIMMLSAVWKGWFRVKRGRTMASLLGGALVLPPSLLLLGERIGLIRAYQSARIQAFLHMGDFQDQANFWRAETVRVLRECTLSGNRIMPTETTLVSQTLDSDFAVTAMLYYYGLLAGGLVLLLIFGLLVRACAVCVKQKNELGMMVGVGCTLALGTQAVTYCLANFGIGLLSQKTMPFLSAGGQGILVNYIMLGLLLSVYRYQDILPPCREAAGRTWKLRRVLR